MATTTKYTRAEIESFKKWNSDLDQDELLEWIVELMSQEDFDRAIKYMQEEEKEYNQ